MPFLGSILLLALPLSAQELAVPDFSEGMSDVNLEKQEKVNGQETFHFTTALDSKEFSATLRQFLGAGWGTRTLNREEMILAGPKARKSNSTVSLSVYENAKLPGIEVLVFHLTPKEGDAKSTVEITVIRAESD